MRVALLACLIACSSKSDKQPPTPPPTPVAIDASTSTPAQAAALDIRVDRRIELLTILFYLAGAQEFGANASTYRKHVDEAFANLRGHAAVKATAELRTKNRIGRDAVINLAVHLDDKYALDNAAELATTDPRFKGLDFTAYAAAVNNFATESKFEQFFASHKPAYDKAIELVRGIVGTSDPIGFFEGMFGPRGTHVVVFALLAGTGNFGVRNGKTMYAVLGDSASLPLLVHEMAHSYVNPLFGDHAKELEASGKVLFGAVEKAMRPQGYVTPEIMLNESGVRALVVLYMRLHAGDDAGAAQARDEMRAGFLFINELVEVFRKYHRDRKTDIEGHMPQVVAFFDQIAKQYASAPPKMPFIGPFDAIYRSEYVLALPASGALADYARKLPFFAKVPIIEPDKALAASAGKHVLAYGTPETNAIVATAALWAKWKITADAIELGGKKIEGKNLVLIACWYRADDPTHGIAVYAAAAEADLVGVNGVRNHGSKDWLVARRTKSGYEVVETGDWPVDANAWVPFK